MNPEIYQQVLNYVRDHLHIPSLTTQSPKAVSKALKLDYDQVLETFEELCELGLIVQESDYLYVVSPWFPLTNEVKDKLRKYELLQTTNRLF